ncbi:predicted protein [Naegleria gruberi]|uniref:Predicted protein n=1 Tax=Naegleria gruberi TaxID=5762 RepID=D2V4N5_NAEGR|nr:uncharacterized protein NAEGRDRAFT_63853 [Naegleria gruberi]EFC48134.1 predicted protein [Naegleria gruberi]|eukprot:XP_002680878.1 predicted protein [Naegleria gruberi strain NEG-M]
MKQLVNKVRLFSLQGSSPSSGFIQTLKSSSSIFTMTRNFSSSQFLNTTSNKREKTLENYLFTNNKIECLRELYRIGLLDFRERLSTTKDRDFIMKLLDSKSEFIQIDHLPEEFRKDKEVIMKLNRLVLDHLPEELLHDRDVINKLLDLNSHIHDHDWSKVIPLIKDDKELMLKAIRKQGECIKFASEKLRNKKAVVLMAVKSNPLALQFVEEKFKNDKSIVSKAVKLNGAALKFASDTFKSDPEIVMQAVNSNPYSIAHATDNLKNDPKIAMAAIKSGQDYGLIETGMGNHPQYILQFVGKELLKDKEFMIKALKIEPGFSYSCYCSRDPDVILSLGLKAPLSMSDKDLLENKQFTNKYFKRIVKDLFGNGSLADSICKQVVNPAEEIKEFIENYKGFIKRNLEKVDTRESALQYLIHFKEIPAKYRSDRELIKELFKKKKPLLILNDKLQQMIDPNLWNDMEFMKELVKIDPYSIVFVSDEMLKCGQLLRIISIDDATYFPAKSLHGIPRLLALELVSKQGEWLEYLNPELRDDREIVYKAVLNNPRSIRYASERLKQDKNLIHMIIDKGLYFHDIHPNIQYHFDIMKRVFEINNLPCTIE